MKYRLLYLVLFMAIAWWPIVSHAQSAPDIRDVRPSVMLILDTSGSMERKAGCACTTPSCSECYPTCGDATVSERNRWASLVEILTGSWDENFYCTSKDRRSTDFGGEYDYGYFIPHHALPLDVAQQEDGVIDTYKERVKFGLMTFDSVGTLTTADPLVPQSTFEQASFIAQSEGAEGMYSYGERKLLTFPGCATDYMVDNGVRNEGTHSGAMISVGLGADDYLVINSKVQDGILGVRPYGGTPIAGALDDARYYYDNHADIQTDEFKNCRPRYIMLITDGYPDQDYRDARFDCDGLDAFGNPTYSCPYELPTEIASDFCDYDSGSGACTGIVKGVFVIGFNVGDDAESTLNDIALTGGTTEALFADNADELRARISEALDKAAPGTTTRSAPAFAGPANSSTQGQYQFSTGFTVGSGGEPWTGVLERKRYMCNPDTLEPELQAISSAENDRFEEVLNDRVTARTLYTVIPGNNTSAFEGVIQGGDLASFSVGNTDIANKLVGAKQNDTARKVEIINWVHGETGSAREGKRLGDIYHSSPVVVGKPNADIADQSYNLFRQRDDVINRPPVVYVGSNDGILHAFLVEDHEMLDGSTLDGGTELWGFLPPLLVPKLDDLVTARQYMVDSTPVVKDVFFSRTPGMASNANAYHSVLIMGLRGGGKGFIAMDVSDPFNPEFLWQFTDTNLGLTYGKPAIGQALFNYNGTLQERAVALLPGGSGAIDTSRDHGPIGCNANGKGNPPVTSGTTNARSKHSCWKAKEGRQFWIVDVESGDVLKQFDEGDINAPIVGTPAMFTGEVGTIATRAYVSDADGILWRVDMSSANSTEWSIDPFHDIYWDALPKEGQPSYEAPLVTVDEDGNVVIIHGTGNTDVLDGILPNRVVSLTETLSFGDTGTTWAAAVNWEITLDDGELVTGPLDLFDGRVYFGSFKSISGSSDACDFGESRVWGVHYKDADPTGTEDMPLPMPEIEYPADSGTMVRHFPAISNVLVMGVGVTQRPTCYDESEETDPYIGTRTVVNDSGGGQFQLVALAGGDAEKSTGQAIGSITRTLNSPTSTTRILSKVSSIE
ncbi:MAG: hypothetical protein IPJ88_05115 [Myxococcales bacterium]|nr:MAG: hypothetical protein IPJ88_05115 [Myxococcales bacterium]